MQDLNLFIKQEKLKNETQQEKPKDNIKMSLLDLKRAVDSGSSLVGNPLVESIKKIDNKIEPNINNTITEQKTVKKDIYGEKDDEFTKQLLMKTKDFITNKQYPQTISENIEPNYIKTNTFDINDTSINKENVSNLLKDTILELYVKERVEGIIKEFLVSDEGKKMIKEIVVNLFKKK